MIKNLHGTITVHTYILQTYKAHIVLKICLIFICCLCMWLPGMTQNLFQSFWMYKADIINVSWIIESYTSLCSIFICNNIQALHILDVLPHFQTNSFQSIWWEKFGFSCCILITNQSNWSRWSCCFIPKNNNIYMYTKIFPKKNQCCLNFELSILQQSS